MAVAPLDLGEFPDVRYAAERRRADRNHPFSADLEADFVAHRLLQDRPLIRAVCLLAMLIAVSRTISGVMRGNAHGLSIVDICAANGACIALVWLAWGRAFERHYLKWAQRIVPLRNALGAAHFAAAAALGKLEVVMLVPMLILGPFFFLGLSFRSALVSGVLTYAVFVVNAFRDLPYDVALHCSVFLTLCLGACAIVAYQYEKGHRTSFLERYLIAELAQRDPLTGTRNRRAFDDHFERLWRRAAGAQRALAIVLVDVDHFKAFNDCYGHLAGDDALRRVAQTLLGLTRRPDDVLARYGGEEFVAILDGVDAEQARRIAERMRRAVVDLGIEHRDSRTCGRVTISIGIAAIAPRPERHSAGALQLADQALYQAKLRGRNRIELMDEAQYGILQTGVFRTGAANTMSRGDALQPPPAGDGAPLRRAG